jgi:hypothetical protein
MCSSFSNFSWIILSGSPSNCLKKSSKSFKNIEKRKGEIKGKCFKIIYNMYNDIKSCVQYNGSQSEFFPCLIGVRQGEN